MSNSIIEQSDPGIVAKETPVRLSDEKLKNMLSRTYGKESPSSDQLHIS